MNERYRIVGLIDQGPVSEVYDARGVGEMGFERRVAIKKLAALPEEGDEFLSAFVDEARIASRLHHPNIVAVLDFGIMDGAPFQVLEHVEGTTLQALVDARGEGLPEPVALHIVGEVAHALDHAHRARDEAGRPLEIVHRDVSPDNVLVSADGAVKLSDFGVASAAERITRTQVGVVAGKLAFMAPEHQLGAPVDKRADLFSLGCVLHFALTGRSPLDTESARRAVLGGGEPTVDPGLAQDVQEILRSVLRSDPRDRVAAAEALAQACGEALAPRLRRDARGQLRAFLAERPRPPSAVPHPLAERMLIEVVPAPPSAGALPRFTSLPSATPSDAPADAVTGTVPLRRSSSRAGPRAAAPSGGAAVKRSETVNLRGAPAPSASAPQRPPTVNLRRRRAGDAGPPPAAVGDVVAGYRLLERVRAGPAGDVFRAEHEVLARACALEIVTEDDDGGGFEARARAAGALEHPSIPRLLEAGQDSEGRRYAAREWVGGLGLDALCEAGGLHRDRARGLLRQVAGALAHAHAHDVVHGDLRPDRVRLATTPDGVEVARLIGGWRRGDPREDLTALAAFVDALDAATLGAGAPAPDAVQWRGLAAALRGDAGSPPTAVEVARLLDAWQLDAQRAGAQRATVTVSSPSSPGPRLALVALAAALAGVAMAVYLTSRGAPAPPGRGPPAPSADVVPRARPAAPASSEGPPPSFVRPTSSTGAEPAPNEAPARARPAPTPRSDAAHRRAAADARRLQRRLDTRLRREGLTRADVSGPALDRFDRALAARDLSEAQAALQALEPRLAADEARVRAKLARAAARLREAAERLPEDEVRSFEELYFELREAVDVGGDWNGLARRIEAFEGALSEATP